MFFFLVAALAFVVALLRGVPLATIAERRFVGVWALVVAAGLHVALSPLLLPPEAARTLAASPAPGLPALGGLLYLVSLSCALVFLALNRRLPGLRLVLLGLVLNFAVIAANGGQMPGDPAQLERAGLLAGMLQEASDGLWSPFTLIGENTRLPFLGDVIYTPLPFREPVIVSVGDLVIAVGVFAFFNPVHLLGQLGRRLASVGRRKPRQVAEQADEAEGR